MRLSIWKHIFVTFFAKENPICASVYPDLK